MVGWQHPLAKATSYSLLGLFGTWLPMWSPAQALVVCSIAFAADGLMSSLLPGLGTMRRGAAIILGFLVPLGSLLIGRGLATFLGLM